MKFPLLPFIGQIVTVEDGGKMVDGVLSAISETHCILRVKNGAMKEFSRDAIRSSRFNFPTFEDAIKHLADAGDARHCASCYIALLYAVEFLSIDFKSQAFVARTEGIRRGVVSFLSLDFPTAGYSLLPQVDGIITQILQEDGLLKQTNSFHKWTKEHPEEDLHGKSCTNLIAALEGAASAGKQSRLRHVCKWMKPDRIDSIRHLRNKLLHGAILDVSEHEAASIVVLLQAVHHGVTDAT